MASYFWNINGGSDLQLVNEIDSGALGEDTENTEEKKQTLVKLYHNCNGDVNIFEEVLTLQVIKLCNQKHKT